MYVKALDERPKLKQEYQWLKEAYLILTRSRQIGMSEFFIPLTEFDAYCNLFGFEDYETKLFLVNVISDVDALLLSERTKEREANNK